MDTIEIKDLLPEVFVGMEGSRAIASSEVWEAGRLTFRRGEAVCVQAESGSGKSSLLSFIYGERTDYRGGIFFDGRDTRSLGIDRWSELRCRSLALMPQEMRLFPELTALENISVKNSLTRHKSSGQVMEMLERLGVAEHAMRPAGRMSIGQQQRVALVRTLCQPFDFILLDEPVSHLDEGNNQTAARMVEEEAKAQGAGIISTSVGNHLLLDHPKIISL
ncbi:MAG: ATP-binding cassette domain-containing protein [Alloprevotella sp.]|nr:ATP-binding cassette domain-containing protein [Alloprevotella sp.]